MESEIWQKYDHRGTSFHSGCAAADLEEAYAGSARIGSVPLGQVDHGLDTVLDHVGVELTPDAVCGEDVGCGAVLPCWHYDGDVLLAGGEDPAVLGVDLVVLLEHSAAQQTVDHFPGEESLTLGLHVVPHLYEMVFQSPECLLLGYAGVGNAVHVVLEKLVLLLGSKVTVVGHPLVMGVCDEVHDVLLEVVGRA